MSSVATKLENLHKMFIQDISHNPDFARSFASNLESVAEEARAIENNCEIIIKKGKSFNDVQV